MDRTASDAAQLLDGKYCLTGTRNVGFGLKVFWPSSIEDKEIEKDDGFDGFGLEKK